MNKIIQIIKGLKLPVTAIIVLIIVLVFTRECNRKESCPPEGKVLIDQSFLDSLNYLLIQPPDTIRDTIKIKGDIVYVSKEVPIFVSIDPETNFYADSIMNDSINVCCEITVKGFINKWDWRYRPIIHRFETVIEKTIPMPVPYEVPVSKAGLYGSFGVGGNESAFMLSGNLDYINKEDNLYGFQYLRFDRKSFYMLKIGKKIRLKK